MSILRAATNAGTLSKPLSSATPHLHVAETQTSVPNDGALTAEVVVGSHLTPGILQEVQQFRERLCVLDDLRTDLPYMLGFHDERRRRPVTIFLRDAYQLRGVVIAYELRHIGLSSGIYLVGDIAGDSAVIGHPADLVSNINAAVDVLLRRPFSHCIRICVGSNRAEWPLRDLQGVTTTVHRRPIRRRLKLARTFPSMLQTFGGHTRRHLNRKRVILEEQGRTRFIPHLQPLDAFEAMVGIHDSAHPRRSLQQHAERCRLLLCQPNAFAMGLQDIGGEWLSFLSGWRSQHRTYIDLQMNNFHFSKESVSAVMRSYMLEHEIERQQTDVIFVGGSSILLQRYCEEDETCFDLLFCRKGLRNATLEKVMRLLSPRALVEYIYESHTDTLKAGDDVPKQNT